MRAGLAALRAAGIKRTRFAARFGSVSKRGIVALEDIDSPIGNIGHAYVMPEHWRIQTPKRPGQRIEFLASIGVYRRDDCSEDLAFFNVRELPA